ncbi:MAG: DUF3109 family protein [Bacteroidota bacterium]
MSLRRKKKNDPVVIQIEDKLVSSEVTQELFACDIVACKGACCVEGELGAPLEKEEVAILDEIYPKVEPFLRLEGKQAIEDQGTWVRDFTGSLSTPLVNEEECAYVTFSENGTALCGIEQAYREGVVDFKKPISCELYPIRVQPVGEFTALNYDRWDICSAACFKGAHKGVKVYEFVKDALIRAYGASFYEQLDQTAKFMASQGDSDDNLK